MVVEGKYIKCNGSGFYANKSGVVWVRSVDREYKTAKRKPKMYMMYKDVGGEFKYVSGLFETKKDNVYSIDEKNNVGIKVFYDCVFTLECIEIQKTISV